MVENIAIERLMRLISSLSFESKLEVLTRLSESIKLSNTPRNSTKNRLLDELFGAWKDVDDNLIEEILRSRSISDKGLSMD